MYDAIVIGAGPAGLSASIYIARAGFSVLVLGNGKSAAEKAHSIDNYFGFAKGVSGKNLLDDGVEQAKSFGCEFRECEVTGIKLFETFGIQTTKGLYEGRTILLATGAARSVIPKLNIEEFVGRGVSFCATCDGFFYKGKKVAVMGSGEFALTEAVELKHFANKVFVIPVGEITADFSEFDIIDKSPISLAGSNKLEKICFYDGSELEVDGVFIAVGVASAVDFAKSTGIMTDQMKIIVNEEMRTSVEGIFAAGDCTGGLLQVAKAVGEGAIAGNSIIGKLRQAQ